MTERALRIGDLIEVPRVATVVRLAEGRDRPGDVCAAFVLTDEVQRHLFALAEALAQDHGQGVFLRGDFGSGKSHFLAALCAWLAGSPEAEALTLAHPGLARLRATGRRFLPVPVSLVDFRGARPLEEILIGEIEQALAAHGVQAEISPRARFLAHLREVLAAPRLAAAFAAGAGTAPEHLPGWLAEDPRRAYAAGWRFLAEQGLEAPQALVEDKSETLARTLAAVAAAGFHGLVVIADELSEFLRAKPDSARLNEDARTLQLLGETAGRAPLWILAAVQESVESVGDIAGPTLRKIKDRYPVLLRLSTLHVRDLIERRLVRRRPGADDEIHRIWRAYRCHFPGFSCDYDLFRRTYPVHPTTLALLEGLGALFSQHRGIVDFVHAQLAGDAQRGIPGVLDRPAAELLAPDALYDHFGARLAEFSDFNVYPRHLVPHFDDLIEQTVAEPDRVLARRLIRILVLHAVHPTAQPPTARALAELAACMLAPHDPDLNASFVARAILAPLAERTPHLVRRPGKSPDPLDATWAVSVERDLAKTLQARIEHAMAELDPTDARVLGLPLGELRASPSWPAPLEELDPDGHPPKRMVAWRGHARQALIVWGEPGEEDGLERALERELGSGAADFALVLTDGELKLRARHALVWRIAAPAGKDADLLREYVAAHRVAAALQPGNPADAPLIAPARERLQRLEPAAQAAVLGTIYAGAFAGRTVPVEPAARQLMRFQRLLEAAGQALLEERYPRFQEIEPRAAAPSARLYHRLLDDLFVPGSLTLTAARTAGLTEAVESLAVPLGLVEVRAGAYRAAPDPAGRPFLAHFFGLLPGAGPAPLAEVRRALALGPYGVPAPTADFLVLALAHAGLVSLLSGGRRLPLEFLNPAALDRDLEIALGEMIGKEDRETLLTCCGFLAPAGGWEAFGLRQQREAWQAALRFRERITGLAEELERQAAKAAQVPAFAGFDLAGVCARARRLREAVDEIRPSLAAREGLERFLRAWRDRAPEPGDLELIERMVEFFREAAEEVLFVAYYVRHAAVERAMRDSAHVGHLARGVRSLLERPLDAVLPDGGRALKAAFLEFREAYIEAYGKAHAERVRADAPPALPASARRAADLLRRLSAIETLDRPPGLDALTARLAGARNPPCRSDLAEELLRSPVCGCGFVPGDRAAQDPMDPEAALEASLQAYREILAAPRVREALRARAFAVADMDAAASERLRALAALLDDPAHATAAALLDRLNDSTVGDLARALAGLARVEKRSLAALARGLGGRRLTSERVRALVSEWLGGAADETILAVQDDAGAGASPAPVPAGWWPRLHGDLFVDAAPPAVEAGREAQSLARALEERFPAARLASRLARLELAELWRFVATEPLHTAALRAAWGLLAERVLADPRGAGALEPASAHLDPVEAEAARRRLMTLRDYAAREGAAFPERLRGRIALARLMHDPWASQALQQAADRAGERLAAAGEDWLAALPRLAPVELAELGVDGGRSATVVVLDGVPPDVWLAAVDGARVPGVPRDLAGGTCWRRLDADPLTVPGLQALFGLPSGCDPAEGLAARGVRYHSLAGNEGRPLADLLPPSEGSSRVVRLALLDRAGHEGTAHLEEMPDLLRTLLELHLPGLCEAARLVDQALVVTTDHGQSSTRQGLFHGRGGVFERAVFRWEWEYGSRE